MKRILISWTATLNDFKRGTLEVDPEGPNAQLHQHFWEYERHLLLCSAGKEPLTPQEQELATKTQTLTNYLRRTFPEHQVNDRYLNVDDVISLTEIRSKVEALLQELASHEIDIFVSPGTGMMQTAWYFVHFGMKLKTRLFHVRRGRDTSTGAPERVFEKIEQSPIPQSLLIQEQLTQDKFEEARTAPFNAETLFLKPKSVQVIYDRAYRIAQTDRVTTLILGESGVGKERLARFIHENSARRGRPFIPVNCAALNDQLLESRLFGYRKGTFTGANEDRKGIFEDTEGGTVFLDEIGDSSPAVQMALLRVLQDHQVTRVGETKGKPVDVRVIAATHRDIAQRCQEGHFRWDLYYRLAVAELELPPLRQWESSEIEALLDYFLLKRQKDFRRPQPLKLTAEARKTLLVYTYPGNFREIEHLIESLYVFLDTEVDYYDLPIRIRNPNPDSSLLLKDVERKHIERVYRYFNGNKSRTAQALGCALNTLKKKISQYEIESI